MTLKQITDSTFDKEVLKSNIPVVVDFWAPWCGPCKMLTPILEELAPEVQSKANIVKLNIDENPQISSKFGVRSVPTMLIFKDGEAVSIQVGLKPKSSIKEWIEANA
jgi:thioredoxin 1